MRIHNGSNAPTGRQQLWGQALYNSPRLKRLANDLPRPAGFAIEAVTMNSAIVLGALDLFLHPDKRQGR